MSGAKFSAAVLSGRAKRRSGIGSGGGRGYLLQHGEIVASGPIADLRDNRLMHELYLGQGNRLRRNDK